MTNNANLQKNGKIINKLIGDLKSFSMITMTKSKGSTQYDKKIAKLLNYQNSDSSSKFYKK